MIWLFRSPQFARLVFGDALSCNYVVNGREYTIGYYLADGATFMKTTLHPKGNKRFHFAMCQESKRKDVEELSVWFRSDLASFVALLSIETPKVL